MEGAVGVADYSAAVGVAQGRSGSLGVARGRSGLLGVARGRSGSLGVTGVTGMTGTIGVTGLGESEVASFETSLSQLMTDGCVEVCVRVPYGW